MNASQMKVGVIGAGNISGIYLEVGQTFEVMQITAVADLDLERARAQAAKYGIARALSVEELLADPDIELVINLTVPQAHAPVALRALEAGKSVYNEKPLAVSRAEARQMLDLAQAKGLRVGGAPDTFLGGGLQTSRKLLDDGWIGQPVAATAFMMGHGPESWHPAPHSFYRVGAGPLFDMGPYYITSLVALLGPVRRVTALARASFPIRLIGSQPHRGQRIEVEVPTHVAGVLEFQSGVIASLVTSFDVWAHQHPPIEIHGSAGSLGVPDPNSFGGPVKIRRPGMEAWAEVPLTHGYAKNSRSLGAADLAQAVRSGRPHRASGELCAHVLDVMHTLLESAQQGRHLEVASTCLQPAPLPLDLRPGQLD